MTISDCNRVVSHTKITQIIHLWYFPALYDGPLKLDTELRQIKTLNFAAEYGCKKQAFDQYFSEIKVLPISESWFCIVLIDKAVMEQHSA